MISDLLSRDNILFVLTRRLNQDPLEHLFSAIRSRGGHNDHPTVRQAAAAIRILDGGAFLRRGLSTNANVEEEVRNIFTESEESETMPLSASSTCSTADDRVEDCQEADVTKSPTPVDFEDSSEAVSPLSDRDTLIYVAGSVLRRVNCEQCFQKMGRFVSQASAEGFSGEMVFETSNLFRPNDSLINGLTFLLQPVTSFFHDKIFLPDIVSHALRRFPLDLPFCSDDHRNAFLRYFYRTIVRTVCKEMNAPISHVKKSKYRKLNL